MGDLVSISVKMPRGLRFLLERASESLGMPMSTIMRLAVSQALSNGIKDISQYAYEVDGYDVITTFKVPLSVKNELKRMARANMVSASEIVRLSLVRLIRTLTPYEDNYVVYEAVPSPAEPSVSVVVPVQEVVP
jgi:antitoxin component of RelBE/YafQ-DinJ toxin-antitoxin module